MPWYAIERCDLCGEVLKDSKCGLCESVFASVPNLKGWIDKVIERALKVHDRDKKSGARMRPKLEKDKKK